MAAACDILTHDETPPPSDRERKKQKSNPISRDPLARPPSLVSLFPIESQEDDDSPKFELAPFETDSVPLRTLRCSLGRENGNRFAHNIFLSGSSFFVCSLSVRPGKATGQRDFPSIHPIPHSIHLPLRPSHLFPTAASASPSSDGLSQTFLAVRENWPL